MKNSCTYEDKQDKDSVVASSSSTEAKHQERNFEITIDIGDKPCIYRVPKLLREVNAAAYTPQLISIGPLHRDLQRSIDSQVLAAMKPHRQRYLNQFCDEAAAANGNEISSENQKQKFLEDIKAQAEKIRRCYDETIDLSDQDLAYMVLFDAAFIIQHFRRTDDVRESVSDHKDDFLIDNSWMRANIKQDLILLENQLPYFILEDLYESAFRNQGTGNFYNLMVNYFTSYTTQDNNLETKRSASDYCLPFLYCYACFRLKDESALTKKEQERTVVQGSGLKAEHFTDFVWRQLLKDKTPDFSSKDEDLQTKKSASDCCFPLLNCCACFRPKGTQASKTTNSKKYWPIPATKLQKAGVQFSVSTDKGSWPLNVTFAKGELTMPPFTVDGGTECLYRNMMAFEQLHCPKDAYFCNYIRFMNNLIDTPEDVDLLVERRVINHKLGDNKVLSDLVNNLDKRIVESEKYPYNAILNALEEHSEKGWFRCLAFMREVYFTNVLTGTLTIAGVIYFFVTITTSIYSCFFK